MDSFFVVGVGAPPERRLGLAVWLQCFKDIMEYERSKTSNRWKLNHMRASNSGAIRFLFSEKAESERNYWEDRAAVRRGTIRATAKHMLETVRSDPSILKQ